MTHELLAAAQGFADWLVKTRRDLHRNPELSLKEHDTAKLCADEFERLGLRVTRGVWGEGFIADLEVEGAKGRVALRADMDALPIHELNEIEYRSRHDGIAHMCGHDTHMTVALGAARLLAERKASLKRSVRFLFQPSEETPPGGAKGLIANGALDGVDEVYGLHNQPLLEAGRIATCSGALTAAADIFEIRIVGRGGHAARPHEVLDPIPVAAALVTQLQTLVSRKISPAEQAVLSVTKFHAGTTHNIIPDDCELLGTVRTFNADVRAAIETEMQVMVDGVAKAHGCTAEFEYRRGYDSIVNHESGVRAVCEAAADILGADKVDAEYPAQTWGEDFAYYLQKRPGAFFLLGSGNAAEGITEPLHSPRFNVDERCLSYGAAIMARLAM